MRLVDGVDSTCSRSGYTVVVAATSHSYEKERVQVTAGTLDKAFFYNHWRGLRACR